MGLAEEDSLEASVASRKFPQSVMIFAIIGIDFQLDLHGVERNIDFDCCNQTIDHLGFSDAGNARHGPFGWIFRQDEAPCDTCQAALEWVEDSVDPGLANELV
jgi:hypothetical protein